MVISFLVIELGILFSSEMFLVDGGVNNIILTSLPATPLPASKVAGTDVLLNLLVPDMEYITLGSCSDFSAVENLGRQIGRLFKTKGIDFWVFGSFKVIADDSNDVLSRVSRSPFLTAHVMSTLAHGLQTAGVVPVFDFRKGYDVDVLQALISRRAVYPFVVSSDEEAKEISGIGFVRPYFVDTGNVWLLHNGNSVQLEYTWSELQEPDLEGARKEILRKSIVLLKPEVSEGKGRIFIKEIPPKVPQEGGVVIFANDTWLMNLARAVLSGAEPATGRKSW